MIDNEVYKEITVQDFIHGVELLGTGSTFWFIFTCGPGLTLFLPLSSLSFSHLWNYIQGKLKFLKIKNLVLSTNNSRKSHHINCIGFVLQSWSICIQYISIDLKHIFVFLEFFSILISYIQTLSFCKRKIDKSWQKIDMQNLI